MNLITSGFEEFFGLIHSPETQHLLEYNFSTNKPWIYSVSQDEMYAFLWFVNFYSLSYAIVEFDMYTFDHTHTHTFCHCSDSSLSQPTRSKDEWTCASPYASHRLSVHSLLRAWGLKNVYTILFFRIVVHSTVHFKICGKLEDSRTKVHFSEHLPIC